VTRETDVLAEIVAQPASDAPRLIWADLVGGERGELVMLQCVASSDRVWSNRRERELLARNALAWSGLAGLVRRVRFVRGFVEAIEVDVETFVARGAEILERAPLITSLTLPMLDGFTIDGVIAHPAFAKIRALDLVGPADRAPSRADQAVRELVRSGKLAQLRALGGRSFTKTGLALLGETKLERLWLRDSRLTRDDIHELARSTPRLVELDLDATGADFAPLAKLWPNLTSLVLRVVRGPTLIDLAASELGAQITRLVIDHYGHSDPPSLRPLDRMPLHSLELRNHGDALRTLPTMGLVDLRELVLVNWSQATEQLQAVVTRFVPQLETLDVRLANRLPPIDGELDVLVDEPTEVALLGTPAKWYVVPPLDPPGPPTLPAWLVCEVGPEPGRIWELGSLGAVDIRIGRAGTLNVSISSASVARVHALLRWHDDAFWIRDTRSTNGTILDGRLIEDAQPLHDGTEITFGTVVLRFFQGEGAGQRATACALRLGPTAANPSITKA
jgi:FHA domain